MDNKEYNYELRIECSKECTVKESAKESAKESEKCKGKVACDNLTGLWQLVVNDSIRVISAHRVIFH